MTGAASMSIATWSVNGHWLREPKRALRITALSLAVLVVACAGKSQSPGYDEYDTSEAAKLFSTGYQEIAEVYIEEVDVSDLALAGLRGLSTLDPSISVEQTPGFVELRVDSKHVRVFAVPRNEDADSWGRLTASVVETGLGLSPTLKQASTDELYEKLFEGALSELDRYSRYASASKAADDRAKRNGFGGIGVRIHTTDAGVEILSVNEGGPASVAGLKEGDIILAVNGKSLVEAEQGEAVNHLRGRVNTKVKLQIARGGEPSPIEVSLSRQHIVPQTVYYGRKGNAAYIRISSFNKKTADSLRDVVERAQDEIGADLTGYIIDLRGNRGGLLSQSVAVADLFIGEGAIVSTEGRHPNSHQSFDATPEELDSEKPIFVLVNGSSASASEIVASALQDSRRAVVIGSASFGKGSVQTVLALPNRGTLTLTWARFHAPSGYSLNRRGVLPNICTSGYEESGMDMLAELRGGGLVLERAVYGRKLDPRDEDRIRKLRNHCPTQRAENDIDVEVAQWLLEDRNLYRTVVGPLPATLAQMGE